MKPNIYQTSNLLRPPLAYEHPRVVYTSSHHVDLFVLFSIISLPTKHFNVYHPT